QRMPVRPLAYRDAGVDIEAGDEAVRRIARLAARTQRPEVLGGIGAFAAFCRVPAGYDEPVLVSSTDGVGSKLKVAFLADRHDTVGIDLVAMGVNDLLVHGAEPFYFLDYLAGPRVEPGRVEAIVGGIAAGCGEAGCALVGGETAEMPDLYAPGEYDLAGFAVGGVGPRRIVTGGEGGAGGRGGRGRRSGPPPRASRGSRCWVWCARCPCAPWPTSRAAASPRTCRA